MNNSFDFLGLYLYLLEGLERVYSLQKEVPSPRYPVLQLQPYWVSSLSDFISTEYFHNFCHHLWSHQDIYMCTNNPYQYKSHVNYIYLRAIPCRFDMRFLSVSLCKYRENKCVRSKNELRSASHSRARIKTNLNFERRYSPLLMSVTGGFSIILTQFLF